MTAGTGHGHPRTPDGPGFDKEIVPGLQSPVYDFTPDVERTRESKRGLV